MTWWEAEQLDLYIDTLEKGLNEWVFSNPQMRTARHKVDKLFEKIENVLQDTTEQDKKAYLVHLADRIERIRLSLTERLKREVSNNPSPRNLLS